MKVELTQKQVTEIDTMLKKIAFANRNVITSVPLEDVVSDLWVNALGIIEKQGSVEMEYIATASKYHIVDMVRKSYRNEYLPYDPSMFGSMCSVEDRTSSKAEDDNSGYVTYQYCSITKGFESTESRQETLSILDLFEDGSKEKALVKAWMMILGIIDCDDPESLPAKAFDRYVAQDVLGYAGSSSNGYMRLRNKVRETLIKNGYKG